MNLPGASRSPAVHSYGFGNHFYEMRPENYQIWRNKAK